MNGFPVLSWRSYSALLSGLESGNVVLQIGSPNDESRSLSFLRLYYALLLLSSVIGVPMDFMLLLKIGDFSVSFTRELNCS